MMRRSVAALLLLVLALPMYGDFGAIARAIGRQKGVDRVSVPFLGFARAIVWFVAPEGIHDFQLATFEGTDRLNPRAMQKIMRSNIGAGYKPLVQVWSRKSGEWSSIYVRPKSNGKRIELMLLAHDRSETVLIRLDADANVIARELGDPRNVERFARK